MAVHLLIAVINKFHVPNESASGHRRRQLRQPFLVLGHFVHPAWAQLQVDEIYRLAIDLEVLGKPQFFARAL
eukprot:CAMPEP_0115600322 /NCGR_PEP_ID=MMETSP0272-20121206/14834_1 /TAXON_ID=71861 /ORGANISM="Scrippsiella trochoidea, Strain CCMP3099" /LENGTH=71 /DNA_ID=CAMNT_0003035773 /DNA_START=144 /DNA_END=359 /DNA_ORIENTATION=+